MSGARSSKKSFIRGLISPRWPDVLSVPSGAASAPRNKRKFVELFTELLERAYLDKIESYNGEKVRYLKDHVDGSYADVDTRIIDQKGQEFSVNYRLYRVNGDWKVYDVVIENVSLVNNYRTQFNRVLAKSSYAELVKRLRAKKLSAPRDRRQPSAAR